ncbi:putative Cation transporter/ATPase, N-terminus [Leishmania utingensis]|uniref:Cation transporter/ATPase, N-terminus n=1 Tax=Leishmania utingensis TaxID=653362 RepID=A0AAW3B065_9TRYP
MALKSPTDVVVLTDVPQHRTPVTAALPSPLRPTIPATNPAIGGEIQMPLEDIFARANEAMPLYEKLGRVEGISNTLHTSLTGGVDAATVAARRAFFGRNALPEDPPLTFWAIYKASWEDSMIRLLTVAAIVA